MYGVAGQAAESRPGQSAKQAEQEKGEAHENRMHAAVLREHTGDPVADAAPIDKSGSDADEDAALGRGFGGDGEKERDEAERRKKGEVEAGKDEDVEERRTDGECERFHARVASSLTRSAM